MIPVIKLAPVSILGIRTRSNERGETQADYRNHILNITSELGRELSFCTLFQKIIFFACLKAIFYERPVRTDTVKFLKMNCPKLCAKKIDTLIDYISSPAQSDSKRQKLSDISSRTSFLNIYFNDVTDQLGYNAQEMSQKSEVFKVTWILTFHQLCSHLL